MLIDLMACDVYAYCGIDGFTYMGMMPNVSELSREDNKRTLIDVAIIPTSTLEGDYEGNIERAYNDGKRNNRSIEINLANVVANLMIPVRVKSPSS